jgi:lipopolysaccharide heptosyltransferase I
MARRILLVRLSAIGDVINTLPAVAAIRSAEPDVRIGYVVEDKAKDVVVGHPDIDEVFVFPKKRWRREIKTPWGFFRALREARAYIARIRARRFDVSLDFQGTLKGALHSWLSGAKTRIGFARGHTYECNQLFSNVRVEPETRRLHRVDKFLSLLQPLGIDGGEGRYRLPEDPAARRKVEAFVDSVGGNGFLVFHPGTSDFAPEKRWGADRYGELARRVVEELGFAVVVTWGPGEEGLAGDVCRASGSRAVASPRSDSILMVAELLRRAKLYVGGDTGPMHLAAACGTPCIALFGPKDPAMYRPYGPGHVVISKGVPSSMESIGVEDVFAAIRARLGLDR